MREIATIAALIVSAVSLLTFAIAVVRYLPRIARVVTIWSDMPAKVDANTQAIAANTEVIAQMRLALRSSQPSRNGQRRHR